jgi:hypothetical protein
MKDGVKLAADVHLPEDLTVDDKVWNLWYQQSCNFERLKKVVISSAPALRAWRTISINLNVWQPSKPCDTWIISSPISTTVELQSLARYYIFSKLWYWQVGSAVGTPSNLGLILEHITNLNKVWTVSIYRNLT